MHNCLIGCSFFAIVAILLSNIAKQPKLAVELAALLEENYTENSADLSQKPAGYIHMQAITSQDISSTDIRKALKNKLSARYLVPEKVIEYLFKYKLY